MRGEAGPGAPCPPVFSPQLLVGDGVRLHEQARPPQHPLQVEGVRHRLSVQCPRLNENPAPLRVGGSLNKLFSKYFITDTIHHFSLTLYCLNSFSRRFSEHSLR